MDQPASLTGPCLLGGPCHKPPTFSSPSQAPLSSSSPATTSLSQAITSLSFQPLPSHHQLLSLASLQTLSILSPATTSPSLQPLSSHHQLLSPATTSPSQAPLSSPHMLLCMQAVAALAEPNVGSGSVLSHTVAVTHSPCTHLYKHTGGERGAVLESPIPSSHLGLLTLHIEQFSSSMVAVWCPCAQNLWKYTLKPQPQSSGFKPQCLQSTCRCHRAKCTTYSSFKH